MKLSNLKDLDKDDVLAMLGLSSKQSTTGLLTEALAVFGVGVLVGAGVALLVAPKPGRQMREEIHARISAGREELART
jgi:hypothetical protein